MASKLLWDGGRSSGMVDDKKSRSAYELPEENMKQIIAVIDNERLMAALEKVAAEESAQVCRARPDTPDIFVFTGNIRIVDREYLGQESWGFFCRLLENVNESPIIHDYQKGLRDEVPLLIVDEDLERSRRNFQDPGAARGGVYYISQHSPELIAMQVKRILQGSEPVGSFVKALDDNDIEGLE